MLPIFLCPFPPVLCVLLGVCCVVLENAASKLPPMFRCTRPLALCNKIQKTAPVNEPTPNRQQQQQTPRKHTINRHTHVYTGQHCAGSLSLVILVYSDSVKFWVCFWVKIINYSVHDCECTVGKIDWLAMSSGQYVCVVSVVWWVWHDGEGARENLESERSEHVGVMSR